MIKLINYRVYNQANQLYYNQINQLYYNQGNQLPRGLRCVCVFVRQDGGRARDRKQSKGSERGALAQSGGNEDGGRVYSCHAWPYTSHMTIDPRIPTCPDGARRVFVDQAYMPYTKREAPFGGLKSACLEGDEEARKRSHDGPR